jgi:predicted RecA/RadA family phage recombinase
VAVFYWIKFGVIQMKNFIAAGDVLDLTAPSGGVISGEPVVIGNMLVIPKSTVSEGMIFSALWHGVFTLPKVSTDTPTQLDKAYWKADDKAVTTTASGNKVIGVFSDPAESGDTVASVLLTGELI